MFDITMRVLSLAARRCANQPRIGQMPNPLAHYLNQALDDEYPEGNIVLEYGEPVTRKEVMAELDMFKISRPEPVPKTHVVQRYAGKGLVKVLGPFTHDAATEYATNCRTTCIVLELENPE